MIETEIPTRREDARRILAAVRPGGSRADRATLAALDDLIRPFVGSASGVNLALEYDPDSNGSN